MNSILNVKDVHFAYDKKEVLCSIDCDIKQNDFFILTGDNGSGKSTLLKIMLGFLEPQIGTISLNTNKIGYIPQTGLTSVRDFPASVYEVVAMRLPEANFFTLKHKKINAKVDTALKRVGVQDLKHKRISDLSGGQLQRVLIARELVDELDILLLDEPTNGLDQKSIRNLMALLKELNEEGLTIGMVSHYIHDIKDDANRLFVMKHKHLYEVNHESI